MNEWTKFQWIKLQWIACWVHKRAGTLAQHKSRHGDVQFGAHIPLCWIARVLTVSANEWHVRLVGYHCAANEVGLKCIIGSRTQQIILALFSNDYFSIKYSLLVYLHITLSLFSFYIGVNLHDIKYRVIYFVNTKYSKIPHLEIFTESARIIFLYFFNFRIISTLYFHVFRSKNIKFWHITQ